MDKKFETLTHEQKLKVSIFNEVRNVCEEVGKSIDVTYTRKSMDLISELVWKRLHVYGEDLEAFAKHAKRSTVQPEDVKLLVRRNLMLKEHLNAVIDDQGLEKKGKQKKDQPTSDSTEPSASTSSRPDSPMEEVFDFE